MWKHPLAYTLIGISVFYILWAGWNQRPVVEFFPQHFASYRAAKSSEVGSVTFRFEKLREPCRISQESVDLAVYDGSGGAIFVNQRSPIIPGTHIGVGEAEISFEVPRFIEPGMAQIQLTGEFICTDIFGIKHKVQHRSPLYQFEVLE
jgi:hypothetical protein